MVKKIPFKTNYFKTFAFLKVSAKKNIITKKVGTNVLFVAKDTKAFKRLHTNLNPELNWDKSSTMAQVPSVK